MFSTLHPPDSVIAVHLWKYCLQKPVREFPVSILSADERHVLTRLAHHDDRKEYFQVHVFLKRVLELYTHLPPEELQLVKGENGKPELKCKHHHPPFYFSLSYCHDYALLAISGEPCVGVDVEEVQPLEHFHPFVASHFSRNERKRILKESTKQRQLSVLYTFWSMKEAYLKSIAIGLSGPIRKYDTKPFLEKPLGVPRFDQGHEWFIDRIPVAKNYRAAFALRGSRVSTRIFDYNLMPEVCP
jgi:4'-phosphopantetheinyl transferase